MRYIGDISSNDACMACSHQQKLQNMKQKLKEAETGKQDAAQVYIFCCIVVLIVAYSSSLCTKFFCHLVILAL